MPNFSPKLEDATESDLKKWINDIGPQYASLASEELTRRQFDKFDKTTAYFSKILGFFAVIQIVVALMQFILSVLGLYKSIGEQIMVIAVMFLAVGLVLFAFYKIIKK